MHEQTIKLDLPPLKLDRDAIAQRLRVPSTSKKREELWSMIDTIEALAKPAVYFRHLEPGYDEEGVTLGEKRISSKSLGKVLNRGLTLDNGRPAAVAFTATWGQEATDWGNAREFGLPIFWAQTILEEAMLLLMAELEKELRKVKDSAVSTIEPGIPEDWPLQQQIDVFDILGGNPENFGITLNDQSLMLPFRYLAGIAYFTPKLRPQCPVCHFTDCNKQRGGCWRLQAIKRKSKETGQSVDE